MEHLLASASVSISELKKNPTAVIDGSLFPSGVIKDFRADVTVLPIASTLGWLRAPINNAFAFVTQGFIDDCAIAAGRDPLEYRRGVLGTPRAIPIAEEFSGETGEAMKGTPYNTGRMRGVPSSMRMRRIRASACCASSSISWLIRS